MTTTADSLRRAGLRCTSARLRVLGAIEALARPLAHAELVAHATLVGMDPITLYRTLATLEEAKLIHRVHGLDGVWRACAQPDGAGCPGNHVHFLCVTCGQMACLVDQPMPRVSAPEGATVEGRQFLAYGTCGTCGATRAGVA